MRTKRRSLIAVLLLNMITLGFYQIYWYFITKTEMNTLNSRNYQVPFFLWFFIPIINIWWFWRFAKAIEVTTKGEVNRWSAFLAPFVIALAVGIFLGAAPYTMVTDSLSSISFWLRYGFINLLVLLPIFYFQSNLNRFAR